MIKVKAKCIKCNFKNGDYRIFNWSPIGFFENLKLSNYMTFSTKGNDSYITEGKEYELELEEISYDSRFGGTYKISSVPSLNSLDLTKLTKEESLEILMDCTSSERIANNIINAYPNFIEIILTKGKEEIDLTKIHGVGEVYLSAYSRNLIEKYKYYAILQHFKEYKLDVADCKQLIEVYLNEEGITKAIEETPYKVLCGDLKKSFGYSDKLISSIRDDLLESEQRCAYLILSVLSINETNGSTRLNGNDLYYYIQNEYSVPELLPLVVETAKTNELFYYDEKSKDLAIAETYLGEVMIKDFIKTKMENSIKLDIDYTQYTVIDDFKMSEKQASALKLFCESSVMVLAGYSGSGKTTSIKGIIKLMESNKLSYTLLAPTGKASMRMTEATHRSASTIHRKVLKEEYIDSDVIIIDEMSMVDLPTAIMLLNAISNPNARIVFVGDPAQLLPVGIGSVFYDIISSNKVPMIMLDEIFRYDTDGGLFVATNVRQGKEFFSNREMVKQNGNEYTVCDNYKFIQTEEIFETLVSEYMKLINKGVKPNQILCLSPFNVKEVGSYRINNAIQAEINQPKPNEIILTKKVDRDKTTIAFRIGDRLLNKKNDYKALPLDSYNMIKDSDGVLTEDDVELTSIFNGQDGIIRDIDEEKMVVQFDEELIVIDKAKLNNVLLAYCISVHSSQGSEADYVINVVSPLHSKMLNRNLLYVADTRGKKKQIDIGDMSTYNEALLIDGNKERDTWLKELLLED